MTSTPSILIVDDEFGFAEMLREILTELGYEALVAINGRLALNVLQDRQVDLVLADIMMPIMDGSELARAMRADVRLRPIPIVLMTSLPTAVPTEAGLYDGVLRKPFTADMLLLVVGALLDNPTDSLEH